MELFMVRILWNTLQRVLQHYTQIIHVYLLVHYLLCTKMLTNLVWLIPLVFYIGESIFEKINANYFIGWEAFCYIPCFVQRHMKLLCSHSASDEFASSITVKSHLWKSGVRCGSHFLISAVWIYDKALCLATSPVLSPFPVMGLCLAKHPEIDTFKVQAFYVVRFLLLDFSHHDSTFTTFTLELLSPF